MAALDTRKEVLTSYEREQVEAITRWKTEEPSVLSKVFQRASSSVQRVVQVVVPEAAVRAVLSISSTAAQRITDTNDILRDAGVTQIEELKHYSLEVSDRLAEDAHRWAVRLASVEGAATGAVGLPGMAADIPAIIVIALRTIYKIAACYGFDVRTPADRDFVLAIMAAAGANEMDEKSVALAALTSLEAILAKQAWGRISQKAAADRMG